MKKTLLISSLFVATGLVSQSAMAEIKIRAGAAKSTYELGGDYNEAKSSYNPTNVGLTFSSDTGSNAGYLDLSYSSGSGTHDGWKNYGTPAESFKRSDFTLTGGVVFLNQNNGIAGNVYVGIKAGSTMLGANKSALIAGSAYYTANPNKAWSEEKFDVAGVVFGGGASFPIAGGRAGSVGVNVGLGVMSATWKDNSITGYNVKSDSAFGGSLGASYTFPFTSNFGVTVDGKYHSYSYNFGKKSNGDPFNVHERISSFGATLYAKF